MFSKLSSLWTGSLGAGNSMVDSKQTVVRSIGYPICDIEDHKDQRTRSLRYFLRLNHTENAMINLQLCRPNCLPEVLVSAYVLGLSNPELSNIFEVQNAIVPQWNEAPAEITTLDWMDHLGRIEYQRAYLDFFEDKVVENGYDWQQVTYYYLFEDNDHLFTRALNAEGAPIIRLVNALRIGSQELATEALTLFSVCQSSSELEGIRDWVSTRTPSGTLNMADILTSMSANRGNYSTRNQGTKAAVEERWQQLNWKESKRLSEEMQQVSLSVLQNNPSKADSLGWLLMTSHALRLLSAYIPSAALVLAQKEWWYHCIHTFDQVGCPDFSITTHTLCEMVPTQKHGLDIPGLDKVYDAQAWSQIRLQAVILEVAPGEDATKQ